MGLSDPAQTYADDYLLNQPKPDVPIAESNGGITTKMSAPLFSRLRSCVLCASSQLRLVLNLGSMPIVTPNFAVPHGLSDDERRAGVPLDLFSCGACGHVQVGSIGNPELQYREYVYTTSLSVGLRQHFAEYAREVIAMLQVPVDSLIVEIGSNDGTLLRAFKESGMRVVGIDPARKIAQKASAAGIPTVADFFSAAVAADVRNEYGPATVIIANNVVANIASLDEFGVAVSALLAPSGTFVFETQYGADVIDHALLDTVYHEHISYFLIRPTRNWLRRLGLELVDVAPIETKGGSFRGFAKKASGRPSVAPQVAAWIANEEAAGMFEPSYFSRLTVRISDIRESLHSLAAKTRSAGQRVGGFGVSVGTSTLLSQFGLESVIDSLYDDDPDKSASLDGPGYSIPVFSSRGLVEHMPGIVIVFAWRYIEPILASNSDYVAAGGTFVVPLPQVRMITRSGNIPMVASA